MVKPKYKGLVVVESPTKVQKLKAFLGQDYKVVASVGHVRDLPAKASEIPATLKKEPWATLGVNVDADFSPLYVVQPNKKKVIKEIKDALKEASELIIATDGDREGESIGWHLVELLQPKVPVRRMVFSEITREAIQEALREPRDIDQHLVNAQETRRVLDRLYGYTLSPLLWKKVARGLSAGRVQSVAVRILVIRELERLAFRSGTYWDLKAELGVPEGTFGATLAAVGGRRVATGKDFDEATGRLKPDVDVLLLSDADANALKDRIRDKDWRVTNIEERQQTRKPYAPFTTSSLQQEANRKLGMSARQTMQVAQSLYENGHITYMRTDSVNLSQEAVDSARRRVEDLYGREYLSPSPRQYATKAKLAQEAHEAIRPAGTEMRTAEELGLSGQEFKLYALIWKRTMATQMAEAQLRFQTVTVTVDDAEFRATGKRVDFPGFFRAYVEGVDDPEAALDDQESALPPLSQGQPVECRGLESVSHETKPPARYTEATLVRALEEEGVGRPSTYATIIGTIQDRGYAQKNGNQLVPTFTAMAVIRLLEKNFPNLVDLGFTAQMEEKLDDIARGEAESLPYLETFYRGRNGLAEQVKTKESSIDARDACTLRFDGIESEIRVGQYGPYFEKQNNGQKITASIPVDVAPADLNNEMAEKLIADKQKGPQSLGAHPEEGLPIYVLRGPFGPYLQLGDVTEEGPKPKRTSIPKNYDPDTLPLDTAVALLALPRTVGQHPETGKVVKAGIGRFGPYVLHDGKYKSLTKDQDVLTVDLDTAVELLKQARSRSAPTPIKELGKHPDDQETVAVYEGRYGPYVKHGKVNATIPKGRDPESVTLEEALEWIAERAARGGTKRRATRGAGGGAAKRRTDGPAPKKAAGGTKRAASGDDADAADAPDSATVPPDAPAKSAKSAKAAKSVKSGTKSTKSAARKKKS